MGKKRQENAITPVHTQIDESQLLKRVSEISENRKARAGSYANQEITLMFWEVGCYINSVVLEGKRAEYGKQIVTTLSQQLRRPHFNYY